MKNFLTSLGEGIKSAFVEYKEVPDDGKTTGQPDAPVQAAVPKTASPIAPAAPVVDPELVKSIDASAQKQLIDAIGASGAELVEELGDIIETLKESIPDETALYKAALKMLGKKGHTAVAILGDYDKCLGVIEAKDREFEGQLKAQFDKRVGSKQQAIANFRDQITQKQAQIAQLQQEMSDLGVKAQEVQAEVGEEEQKLNLAQDRFSRVYQTIRAAIEAQRAKVAQYGGNG